MVIQSSSAAKQACAGALTRLRSGDPAPMAGWLRAHLLEHVLPFWERSELTADGGLSTCVADDGTLLSRDKWMWSQWRAVWTFSRVYRQLGRNPRWLERAREIFEFCGRSGWIEGAGGWALLLDGEGRILRGHESIYSDAFAVSGLLEYHLASGDASALAAARRTMDAALTNLQRPYQSIPHFPFPIPRGAKPHGLPMIWSLVLAELGAAVCEKRYLAAATAYAEEIFRDFRRGDRDLILEYVREDGGEFRPPEGTAVVPGHVIEDMWFQIHVADLTKQPTHIPEACRLILRHLELGWDHNHGGGLLLAVDAGGHEPVGWNFADTKLWWPQTEALYAALLGWQRTRQPVYLDWYERLWSVCLEHFADWQNGEWRQKLDRRFQPLAEVVALPVKDPFHLPRSLLLQLELLESSPARL